MVTEIPRWQYRFRNFMRALSLLRDAIEQMDEANRSGSGFSDLEKEGTIQRFEYTWELAWNVLKDYLQNEGITLSEITPKKVIRAAFQANVIADGEMWMQALDARNKMSHTYDFEKFEEVIVQIKEDYLPAFEGLHAYLLEKVEYEI